MIPFSHDFAVIDPGPDREDHLAALQQAIGGRRVAHVLVATTISTWAHLIQLMEEDVIVAEASGGLLSRYELRATAA